MNNSVNRDQTQTLHDATRALESAQNRAQETLEADAACQEAYGKLLTLMRLNDAQRAGSSRKAITKGLASAPEAVRKAVALLGPRDGIAKGIIEHLPDFLLDGESRLLAALACAQVEPERTLATLGKAGLDSVNDLLQVALAALPHQETLDFEEQKKAEIVYAAAESLDERQAREARRAFDDVRGRRVAHARRHLLRLLPETLFKDPETAFALFHAALHKDPYGSLEALRASEGARPFQALDLERKLDLLALAASFGLGLASNYLDLFDLPDAPELGERLKPVFVADLIMGSSIYGIYALEGAQHYPFGLRKIEPALPRRINNAEALAWLKKDVPSSVLPTTYSPLEIGNAADHLQEREVMRFLELLKADIFLEWKACFSQAKLDVVFGDLELKIRNILFLVAKALFRDDLAFEQLLSSIASAFPAAGQAHVALLANRHFFLEALGLNPGMLFGLQRGAQAQKAPIEEVNEFRIRYLLHVGMSIHLQVGELLFQCAPIAWNLLQNQGEGGLDTAVQEVVGFFDAFDLLLVLGRPLVQDLGVWTLQVVEALGQGEAKVPLGRPGFNPATTLRLMTKEALGRYRELLNTYCLQVLRCRADAAGVSPTTVIQTLRLPRTKTDKLFTFLEAERQR